MQRSSLQRTYDVILLVTFLLVITAPLAISIYQPDREWSEVEKRKLSTLPQLPENLGETPGFLKKFESYYNDHFGLREKMIERYHREMEKRFGVAGTPLVLKGEDKWLYYTGNSLLDDFRGSLRLSSDQLKMWEQEQWRRYRWLRKKNIAYITFATPNKQSVYPDFLPEEYRKSKGESRLEQLHGFLQHNPVPFYVELLQPLIDARPQRKLFYALDSHWNHYGAYIGFRQVMGKVANLFPENSYLLDFPFHKHYRRTLGGDLARMLMLDSAASESMPKVRPRKYCSEKEDLPITLTGLGSQDHHQPLLKTCDEAVLKAIVFCDSFIEQLEPFLSENFKEVLYLRKSYDEQNITEALTYFTPDIVIEQRVERNYFRQILDEKR